MMVWLTYSPSQKMFLYIKYIVLTRHMACVYGTYRFYARSRQTTKFLPPDGIHTRISRLHDLPIALSERRDLMYDERPVRIKEEFRSILSISPLTQPKEETRHKKCLQFQEGLDHCSWLGPAHSLAFLAPAQQPMRPVSFLEPFRTVFSSQILVFSDIFRFCCVQENRNRFDVCL